MADTPRTRAQLLTLFADNVIGAISEQDHRDGVVTWMPAEFVNPGDAWNIPLLANITTDKSGRGTILYSQIIDSACSFGNIMQFTPSTTWNHFEVANSDRGYFGVVLDSYASAESQAQVLVAGLIKDSVLSGTLSVGKTLYVASASFAITHTRGSSVFILGFGESTDTWRLASVVGKVAAE
jgi:hypothetical protein